MFKLWYVSIIWQSYFSDLPSHVLFPPVLEPAEQRVLPPARAVHIRQDCNGPTGAGCGTSFPCTTGEPAQESASSRTLDGTQPPLYCGFFGSEAKILFQSIRLNWLKGWQNMSLSTLLNPTGQITFPIKFHPSYSVRVIFLFIPLPNLAASESKQILYLVACWQARGCSFWCNVK